MSSVELITNNSTQRSYDPPRGDLGSSYPLADRKVTQEYASGSIDLLAPCYKMIELNKQRALELKKTMNDHIQKMEDLNGALSKVNVAENYDDLKDELPKLAKYNIPIPKDFKDFGKAKATLYENIKICRETNDGLTNDHKVQVQQVATHEGFLWKLISTLFKMLHDAAEAILRNFHQ